MPNWKKVILSGSDAVLNNITASGGISASSYHGDGSNLTGIDGFPFTGSAIISGGLNITGALDVSGSLTLNGDLSSTGSAFISGGLILTGSISSSGELILRGPSSRIHVIDNDSGNYGIELIPSNGPLINFGDTDVSNTSIIIIYMSSVRTT